MTNDFGVSYPFKGSKRSKSDILELIWFDLVCCTQMNYLDWCHFMQKDLNKINHTAGQESRRWKKQWWGHTTYSNQHLHLQQKQWDVERKRKKEMRRETLLREKKHTDSKMNEHRECPLGTFDCTALLLERPCWWLTRLLLGYSATTWLAMALGKHCGGITHINNHQEPNEIIYYLSWTNI